MSGEICNITCPTCPDTLVNIRALVTQPHGIVAVEESENKASFLLVMCSPKVIKTSGMISPN